MGFKFRDVDIFLTISLEWEGQGRVGVADFVLSDMSTDDAPIDDAHIGCKCVHQIVDVKSTTVVHVDYGRWKRA